MRPTLDGWMTAVGALALAAVALGAGNNALFFVVTPLVAVFALDAAMGRSNVRGLRIARRWPAELVAGRPARGALRITRSWGTSRALRIVEGGTEAAATVGRGPGQVPFTWRFEERGDTAVRGFVVTSTWPFGLWRHEAWVAAPDQVLVGVRPRPTGISDDARVGDGRMGRHGRQGTGDLVGLRAYVPGDPLRRVHWPTSARVGEPVVVERTEDEDRSVLVRVRVQAEGPRWERELSEAAGQIQRAYRQGSSVGLALPALGDQIGVVHAPNPGEPWRRFLLDQLARMPRVAP